MKQVKRINRISVQIQKDGSIDITVPASMAEDFKLMVKKGTNLSPDMHVEIRDFTDRLFQRDHLMNGNMLEAIPKEDIVATHWDIPAEDKFELAQSQEQTKQYLGIVKKD
jgi:hypothetical protein